MSKRQKVRIGAVNYLNTKPLVYRLEEFAPQAEILFDLPSRLADDLANEKLDVALIPSIEFFQNPSYSIISDACIGCRGPVLSVKLFSRTPMEEIRTLALDEGSRTSVALSRILLEEKHKIDPELVPLPIGDTLAQTDADAVLLIGDRAIHPSDDSFVEVWDLGQQWNLWTQLPMVFAMWTARAGVNLSGIEAALCQARDEGLKNLEEIAEQEAPHVGLSPARCLSYFRENLHFVLGSREQLGLEHFYKKSAAIGLAPKGLEFHFDDCTTT